MKQYKDTNDGFRKPRCFLKPFLYDRKTRGKYAGIKDKSVCCAG